MLIFVVSCYLFIPFFVIVGQVVTPKNKDWLEDVKCLKNSIFVLTMLIIVLFSLLLVLAIICCLLIGLPFGALKSAQDMCDDSNLVDGNCINLNFLYSNSHLICRNTSEKDTFCRNVEMFLKMNVACFIALGLATAGLIVGLANFCFVYSYLRSLYDQKFKKDVFGTIPLATRFAISAVMMQSSEPSGRGKQGPSVDYRRHSRLPKREPFLIP